jgi:hypothetical protein
MQYHEFQPEKLLEPDKIYNSRIQVGQSNKGAWKICYFIVYIKTVKPSFKVMDYGLRSAAIKINDLKR